MRLGLLLALTLCGCPKQAAPAADAGSLNPYHDVRPQKVKEDVEKIEKKEDEQNDKRMEQMK